MLMLDLQDIQIRIKLENKQNTGMNLTIKNIFHYVAYNWLSSYQYYYYYYFHEV